MKIGEASGGLFADRIQDVPRSFIREILKVTTDKSMISFAGGLPNRHYFPVDQLRESTNRVFDSYATDCLQYSNSEGLPELRECIAKRYRIEQGIAIPPERILITNGSQQALDLIAKVTVNNTDPVIIEEPGYLGAIQALSLYRPRFVPVQVNDEGMDVSGLKKAVKEAPKLMYTVPNFQNPSGISYSEENRRCIADILQSCECVLVEDDPYGSLRFAGKPVGSFYHLAPEQTILLGSFSKTVVPGFRLGWVAAPEKLFDKLLIAKQASDLHTCNFTQYVLLDFLTNNDIETHLEKIRTAYGNQCRAMIAAIERDFPDNVSCTRPDGGMFLWGRLPEQMSSLALFDRAVEKKVAFVPGEPFYTRKTKTSTFRLNFSCTDVPVIEDGISRLAEAIMAMESG